MLTQFLSFFAHYRFILISAPLSTCVCVPGHNLNFTLPYRLYFCVGPNENEPTNEIKSFFSELRAQLMESFSVSALWHNCCAVRALASDRDCSLVPFVQCVMCVCMALAQGNTHYILGSVSVSWQAHTEPLLSATHHFNLFSRVSLSLSLLLLIAL